MQPATSEDKEVASMRRILLLLAVAAMLAATMVASSGAAFAARHVCPVCPVAANDQAQGSFSTGSTQGDEGSGFTADQGLRNAFMNNTNP